MQLVQCRAVRLEVLLLVVILRDAEDQRALDTVVVGFRRWEVDGVLGSLQCFGAYNIGQLLLPLR